MRNHAALHALRRDFSPKGTADKVAILRALGTHGVLCFPAQALDARSLKSFSERFGSLQGSPTGDYCEPGVPEVMLLSNIIENGKPIGMVSARNALGLEIYQFEKELTERDHIAEIL